MDRQISLASRTASRIHLLSQSLSGNFVGRLHEVNNLLTWTALFLGTFAHSPPLTEFSKLQDVISLSISSTMSAAFRSVFNVEAATPESALGPARVGRQRPIANRVTCVGMTLQQGHTRRFGP